MVQLVDSVDWVLTNVFSGWTIYSFCFETLLTDRLIVIYFSCKHSPCWDSMRCDMQDMHLELGWQFIWQSCRPENNLEKKSKGLEMGEEIKGGKREKTKIWGKYNFCQYHNKTGFTATLVACGWAGAVLEKVSRAPWQEQSAQKAQKRRKSKKGTNRPTDRHSGV